MKILYFEKAVSDVCLLGAFVSVMGILIGLSTWIIGTAIVVVSVSYLVFCAIKKRWLPEYDNLRQQLIPVILVYSVLMIAASYYHMTTSLYAFSIPLFIAWLLLSMLVMQASRHENPAALGLGFYLANFVILAAVLALCWAASTEPFWHGVGWGLGRIWLYVFRPVLSILALLVYWIIYGFFWLIQLIVSGGKLREIPKINPDLGNMDLEEMFGNVDTIGFPIWLKIILNTLGALIFLALAFLVIRRLAGGRAASTERRAASQKILPAGERKAMRPDWRLSLSNRARIRSCWRRFQKLCAEVHVSSGENVLSAELAASFTAVWQDAPVQKLREIWLPARYSSAQMTMADVQAAQHALREIRAAVRDNIPNGRDKNAQPESGIRSADDRDHGL